MALDIIIIGAGVAGLSAAIAIKTSIPKANISIHEIRSQPSSIGGAVNLTPNALRYLSALGALDRLQKVSCPVKKIDVVSHRTGSYLGRVNFDIPRGDGFQALRVKRSFLLDSLATTWQETGGHVSYDSRAKSIQRAKSGRLVVEFHNQQSKEADVVLGCDGIHSFVRAQYVQVDRQPEYSGIATAYGIMDCTNLDLSSLSIDTTKVLSSQRGALLLSFTDVEKKELYIGAVMETEEIDSREGWKAKGANKEMIKSVILDRFCAAGPVAEKLRPVVEEMEDWFLYPVFKLPPKGRWLRDNVLVIGDAAHAMPPQGESTGFAIEDAMLLARVLEQGLRTQHESDALPQTLEKCLASYGNNRARRIDPAYDEANMRWDQAKDIGWLQSVSRDWLSYVYLWWTEESRNSNFAYDVRTAELI